MSRAFPLLSLLCLCPGPALADDPLDRVSGTENWKAAGPEDPDAEWKEWYRLRVEIRRARVDLRLQAARSQRLRVMLLKAAGARPDMGKVRKVMRARLVTRRPKAPPKRKTAGRMEEGTFLLPGESAGQVAELEPEQPRPRRGRTNGSKTPEPPRWVKVPVERLDDTGQAVDDEGDRELERSLRKNPSK